jgi:RNA polymerase sigma-70 factor (ECF subfamily)
MSERGHQTRAESRKAWLFRVAYNEAMAIRRREAVGDKVARQLAQQAAEQLAQQVSQQRSLPAWHANGAAGPAGDPLVRQEAMQAVQAALDELPPEQRQVVRMRIHEEKTFAVIAKELKIPLGTALARMRSALMKLRARLDSGD